jgi:hypothetical protein
MKYTFFLLPLFFVLSCKENDSLEQNQNLSKIEIFLVEGEGSTFLEPNLEMNTLQIENTPWLKHSEILFYDWSSHMFFLNTEKEKEKYAQRNFVVMCDEEPLFVGVFFPMYLSSIPQMPSILAADGIFVPEDVVSFGQYGYFFSGNVGERINFKEALIDAGLYREGIQVELLEVDKLNTNELEYTISITNRDTENIYILDVNKMGENRFHYFTNGVLIRENGTSYFPVLDNIITDEINNSWYTKLHSGEQITRTIKLGGYDNLPSGKVTCNFVFPGSRVQHGEWLKSDGRVWLGNLYVEDEFVLN